MKEVKRYSDLFKRKVILEYENSDSSMEYIRKKYGIGGSTTIDKWRRKFAQTIHIVEMSKEKDDQDELSRLRAEIEVLRRELDYERMSRLSYQTMIRIAEKELDIEIEKKSGAKQSKK